MTTGGVIRPGEGRAISYAGQPMHVLAELPDFAAAEMVVPPKFAGPVPHVHRTFDEAIYVLDGELLLTIGRDDPVVALTGSLCLARRGTRHTFANPTNRPVRVLGLWTPGPAGLAFMADVGAVIPPEGAPDPAAVAEAYRRHASELAP
jgi:mannose-6-phosphate isomerase-like protein (cupin superfamily)